MLRITLAILLFVSIATLYGNETCYTAQVRAGYFYPVNSVFRKIYRHGGIEFEGEASAAVCDSLTGWLNLNYFSKRGHSLGKHEHTKIQLLPLSMGFKYFMPLADCSSLYLGAGASYTFIRVHDNDSFLTRHLRTSAWGAVGKFGLTFKFSRNWFGDLFADYYYTRATIRGNSRDVGGLRTGAGLGLAF